MKEITKHQAILIHSMIYTVCYDIKNKTKKVDKVLKQIRKGVSKLDKAYYKEVSLECHNAWGVARSSIIKKDSKLNVKVDELLMSLYNSLSGSKFQNMYYSDNSFTSMSCSFDSCITDHSDDFAYTANGRDLANAFIKEIGIVKDNKLKRMIYNIEQNAIIEKG